MPTKKTTGQASEPAAPEKAEAARKVPRKANRTSDPAANASSSTKPDAAPVSRKARSKTVVPEQATLNSSPARTQGKASSATSRASAARRGPDLHRDADNRPGYRLVQQINFEMARRGIRSYTQVSFEMGFVDDPKGLYVQRMQSGWRSWNTASLDRLRMVAEWLAMAPLEVMMLADVITVEDSLRETIRPDQLDRRVCRIQADPEYGKLLPHYADFSVLPPWVKILLLLFYDEINRFRLADEATRADIPKEGLMLLARRLPKAK